MRFLILPLLALTACSWPAPKVVSYEEMTAQCEKERRGASAPTGNVSMGVGSETGVFGGLSINVTDKFLTGADPDVVYKECMERISAQNQRAINATNSSK